MLGAGGEFGGYFGGRLIESGADVTFLVREGRRKILSEQGLRIESPFGDAQLAVASLLLRRASRSPTSFSGCREKLVHISTAAAMTRLMRANKAREANIAHRALLFAYTHIKAFGQRRAAGPLP